MPTPTTGTGLPVQRDEALDGLRGVAILLVVAFHVRTPGFFAGFIGVDIFFLLSGYLITSLLRDEARVKQGIDFWQFWIRRLVRLVPALAAMLVGVCIVAPLLFPDADLLAEVLLSGLFISDYTHALWGVPVLTQHSWSLAVEAKFYLIWPLAVILLSRWVQPRTAVVVIVALFLFASVWRGWAYHVWGWERAYYAFDTRVSGLLLGAAFAWSAWRPSPAVADRLAGAGTAGLCVAILTLGFYTAPAATWGGVLVDLSALALLAGAVGRGPVTVRMLSRAPLVRIGLWSHSIYLWHYPIARVVRLHVDGYPAFAITLGISVVLAWLTFSFIEQPARQWVRRMGKAGGASAPRPADRTI